MSYDNTNTGTLWRNENRPTEKHPEYRGSINVDGKEFWVSAWVNEAGPKSKRHGEKYFSLKIQTKEDRDQKADELQQAARGGAPVDDEIPFSPDR